MSSYVPIKHAYDTCEPAGGVDSSLSPVIFLHGVAASKEAWKDIPQKVANATKRKVYNVDIRNHGDTEWTDEFDFILLKKDALHFMETINCPKAIFVSNSVGARTAIQLAFENPGKVEKVVIEEMMVRKPGPHLLGFAKAFTALAPKSLDTIPKGANEDEAVQAVLKYVCDTLPPEAVKKNNIMKMDKTCVGLKKTPDGGYAFKANLKVLADAVKNAANVLLEPEGSYNGPAFFIYGSLSPYAIANEVENIKERFPNAEFLEIKDAGHIVHLDKPQEFTDALIKFLLK